MTYQSDEYKKPDTSLGNVTGDLSLIYTFADEPSSGVSYNFGLPPISGGSIPDISFLTDKSAASFSSFISPQICDLKSPAASISPSSPSAHKEADLKASSPTPAESHFLRIAEASSFPAKSELVSDVLSPQIAGNNCPRSKTYRDNDNDSNKDKSQSLLETNFTCESNSHSSSRVVAGEISANLRSTAENEIEVRDAHGAALFFGRFGIYPHKIRYKDRTEVEFLYDENENAIQLKDRDGMIWTRQTWPDENGFARWTSGKGESSDLSLVVLPNGTWQVVSGFNCVQTCTTDGAFHLWRPFPDEFDLNRTLFAIFKLIDKNQDSTLSQEEIANAAGVDWKQRQASELVVHLNEHFEEILRTRRHAATREGYGITIEDILAFDLLCSNQQNQLKKPPEHLLNLVEQLFRQLDKDRKGALTVGTIGSAYNERSQLNGALRSIVEFLQLALTRNNRNINTKGAEQNGNLTLEDVTRLFGEAYRETVANKLRVGGWPKTIEWLDKENASKKLFAHPESPLSSIQIEALRQFSCTEADFSAALASLTALCPHMVQRMVRDNSDGTYSVTFPGACSQPLVVVRPNQEEIANFLSDSSFGIWPAVIMAAFEKYASQNIGAHQPLPRSNVEAADAKCALLDLLTGESGHWLLLDLVDERSLALTIRNAIRQRRNMVCARWTGALCKVGRHDISGSRLHGIVGYEQNTGTVVLFNAVSHDPPSKGSDTAGSIMRLSVSNFKKAFDGLYMEDWSSVGIQ
ncbi:MAG TPA: hypothetical protein V6D17_13790 [Candidatus Obscuribacterales bacterium]